MAILSAQTSYFLSSTRSKSSRPLALIFNKHPVPVYESAFRGRFATARAPATGLGRGYPHSPSSPFKITPFLEHATFSPTPTTFPSRRLDSHDGPVAVRLPSEVQQEKLSLTAYDYHLRQPTKLGQDDPGAKRSTTVADPSDADQEILPLSKLA